MTNKQTSQRNQIHSITSNQIGKNFQGWFTQLTWEAATFKELFKMYVFRRFC